MWKYTATGEKLMHNIAETEHKKSMYEANET